MISQLVSLSDLTFRKEDYKVFYIDAIEKRNQLENELRNIQKAESFMEKIEDIYYFWSAATLIPCLEALDIAPVYPKIKAKLDDIIEKGFCIIPFSTSIRNNDGNLFAMDTVPLYLGNVCDYQDIQIGLFSESNYLDKSLTLKNINLFFAQAQSGESRSTALIVENSV